MAAATMAAATMVAAMEAEASVEAVPATEATSMRDVFRVVLT